MLQVIDMNYETFQVSGNRIERPHFYYILPSEGWVGRERKAALGCIHCPNISRISSDPPVPWHEAAFECDKYVYKI